ncbi:outer membrane lipid asymmetry maintenance protein MlaD [Candidatus Pandoraea novymonadis]|uniref:Phospholipid ABC transporter-binding protein MlaD n=1 Tax=Candidatus Pandoraea novymonadis TaxID=1808959 RepID=A0ABX5FCQ0_9BURK|nr:outer membrane lipid asymmetry maintenance protein MlaD [Candidatus Pandoraea novymonadis]PSB91570.1 putative phospholipid ABC transporter-binding protein MlaD [Candidatus Pandoraea novymonadis]
MKKHALDFWVGIFLIFGIAALLFLALKVGNMSSLSFNSTYPVKVNFDNIGSLRLRAAVKSSGVVVGRVASIKFDDKRYVANVILDIDSQYHFPKESSAKILTSGLLGEQYIGLEPGGDDEMLVANDTIMISQSAIVIEDLISQFLYKKIVDEGGVKKSESGLGGVLLAPEVSQEK